MLAVDETVLANEMGNKIVGFVYGLRGPRPNPVTRAQILVYMSRFPMFKDVDIEKSISALCHAGKIICGPRSLSSSRKSNGAYEYSCI